MLTDLKKYCDDISKRDTLFIKEALFEILSSFPVVIGTYNKITYGIYFVNFNHKRAPLCIFKHAILRVLLESILSFNRALQGSRRITTTTTKS